MTIYRWPLMPGELHCLLGENGAGKSTFSAVPLWPLAARCRRDRDRWRHVDLASPARGDRRRHRHGASAFRPGAELHGSREHRRGHGFGLRLDMAAARAGRSSILPPLRPRTRADRLVADLSVGEKQWVEIVKALYLGARLLILDEPTAVLTPQESSASSPSSRSSRKRASPSS